MIRRPAILGLAGLASACSGTGTDLSSHNLPPVAAFAAGCTNLTCRFTDASTDADGRVVSYRWSFGDGSDPSTGQEAQHAFAAAGSYSVELQVTDDEGATGGADSVVTISVHANTMPVAGFESSCAGLSCSFTDSSQDPDGQIATYQWSFGDASPDATGRDASHTYAASGDYTVWLTVTDDSGGAAGVTHLIQVVSPPNTPPTAGFGAACVHLTCTFSDSSSDADDRVAWWSWAFGDGSYGYGPSPVHTYFKAGSYHVQLTVGDDRDSTGSADGVVTVPVDTASEAALVFSDDAIGFCDSPGSTRNCVRVEEHVLFSSTGARLAWEATTSAPWIRLQPASGRTDTDVRVFVDFDQLPPRNGALSVSGSITVSANGAGNSPQTIPVRLQFYSSPPPR